MALLSTHSTQTGIRATTARFNDVNLFRNVPLLDSKNIGQWDPYITGYAAFFITKMPYFMERTNPVLCERLKNFLEKGHTSFEGINDNTVQTDDIMGGIAGNTFQVMTNVQDEFTSFSINCREQNGSLLREGIDYWVTGIRDRKSGICTYQGLFETEPETMYSIKNHTAEALYIVFDPTMRYTGIEYACLLANIFPTKIPASHLNMTHGDHATVDVDLDFSAVKYESDSINKLAVDFMKVFKPQNYYDLNIDINYAQNGGTAASNMVVNQGVAS